MTDYQQLSLWFDQLPRRSRRGLRWTGTRPSTSRSSAPASPGCGRRTTCTQLDPTLRIAVLEAEVAGFGASGRNGGWCSALYPVSISTLAAEAGRDAAIAQYAAMRDTVAEVVRVAAAERIDADIAAGGTIVLARSAAQLQRAHEEVAEARDVRPRPRPARCRRRPRPAQRDRRARRDVHRRLRGRAARPACPRAGRGRRSARRAHLRAHPRRATRARRACTPTTAPCAPT